jgi:quinol monooxygenase YgiN
MKNHGKEMVMIITYRFVRLVEDHSDALASSLLRKVQSSPGCADFDKVPPQELEHRVYEIYRHLGEWLLHKNESDVEQRYMEIGRRRAQQSVPLSQVIWAIILTKRNLWEFILDEAFPDRPVEILGKQELLQLLDQFFDWAMHAAAVGYERSAEANAKADKNEMGLKRNTEVEAI